MHYNLLIIEDDLDLMHLMRLSFESERDFTLYTAHNVSSMLGAPLRKIDGIITDFMLMNYTCDYILLKLHETKALRPGVPILIYTALANSSLPQVAMERFSLETGNIYPYEVMIKGGGLSAPINKIREMLQK